MLLEKIAFRQKGCLLRKFLEELKSLGISFIVVLIIFKGVFFKEALSVLVPAVFILFWMFFLPGWALLLAWQEKLGFLERMIIGGLAGAGVMGLLGYYLGIVGIHAKVQPWLLPPIIIGIGILGSWLTSKKDLNRKQVSQE